VYLDGEWQRIDPTAMIAPQRIDSGMQNYMAEDQKFGEMHRHKHGVYSNLNFEKYACLE
jgi:hypothetical protein